MGRFIFLINTIFMVRGALLSTAMPDCSKDPLKSNKVCDTAASPADRAAALVGAMKQEEKLANIVRWVLRLHALQSRDILTEL